MHILYTHEYVCVYTYTYIIYIYNVYFLLMLNITLSPTYTTYFPAPERSSFGLVPVYLRPTIVVTSVLGSDNYGKPTC